MEEVESGQNSFFVLMLEGLYSSNTNTSFQGYVTVGTSPFFTFLRYASTAI